LDLSEQRREPGLLAERAKRPSRISFEASTAKAALWKTKREASPVSLLVLRSSSPSKLEKDRLGGRQAGVLGVLNPRSKLLPDVSLPSLGLSLTLEHARKFSCSLGRRRGVRSGPPKESKTGEELFPRLLAAPYSWTETILFELRPCWCERAVCLFFHKAAFAVETSNEILDGRLALSASSPGVLISDRRLVALSLKSGPRATRILRRG
jgi:hypothetical protein